MRPILLIGPQEDPVLLHFANYAKTKNNTVYHWSDLSDMQFTVEMEPELGGNVRFSPSNNNEPIREFSIFLHRANELFPYIHDPDERFRVNEIFAAVWSMCALNLHPVVNRPGMLDWQFDKLFQKTSINMQQMPNLYLSNPNKIFFDWKMQAPDRELHIENRVTGSKAIFTSKEPFQRWINNQESDHYRMVFPTNSNYLIYLVAGDWTTVLLNETKCSPDAPENKNLLRKIHDNLTVNEISFYAVVLTYIEGTLKILRIETNPPFEWYKDIKDEVHFYLLQHLQGGERKK